MQEDLPLDRMTGKGNREDETRQGKMLLEAMQDNSCWLTFSTEDHPRQKPKQSYCFNAQGRLPYGQGATHRCRPSKSLD